MVVIDFETASEVNIKEQGSMRYFTHPSTQILMLGYKIDNGPVKQIFYGDPFPKEIMENGLEAYLLDPDEHPGRVYSDWKGRLIR